MEFNIEQFDPTVAQLQGIVEDINKRLAENPEDLKVIKECRIQLKNARVAISKKGKELREGAVAFQRQVIAREKELIEIVEPEEDRLQAIEEAEKERMEMIKRKAVLPQLQEKLSSIGDGIEVSDEELLKMDEKAFDTYYNSRVTAKNEKDRQSIQEEKDKIQKEKDDLARAKEIEEAKEKARLEEKEKSEKAEQERKEREEREKEEARKKHLNYRIQRLENLGLKFNIDINSYILDDFNVHHTEILTLNDMEFDMLIQKISMEISKRRETARIEKEQKESQAEIERKQKAEAERIEREKQEEEKRVAEEQKKLQNDKAYQNLLSSNGYSEETKDDFKIEKVGTSVKLYKLVDYIELQ
jgi:hypothetical protein